MYNCRCTSMQMVSKVGLEKKKTISYHTPSQAITLSLWNWRNSSLGNTMNISPWRIFYSKSITYILITHTHYVHGEHPSRASASKRPVLAFRNPTSQSGTGAFRYRTGSPYSDIRLVQASAFFFILTPDTLHAGQSGIPAFKHNFPEVYRDTPCTAFHADTADTRRLLVL
jgi:hypothetical protein